jgi:hypothetical protein
MSARDNVRRFDASAIIQARFVISVIKTAFLREILLEWEGENVRSYFRRLWRRG